MAVYIQSTNQLSAQQPLSDAWFEHPVFYDEKRVATLDPKFSDYLPPLMSRRMCALLKRAVVMSRLTLKEAGIEMPDAIISGTGLGCIDNTEKFLISIMENDEKFLQPTYFMQSTHNIISSTIAIDLKCHGYNNSFVHRGVSFEHALFDAFLQFEQNRIKNALVGGYDELTDNYYVLFGKMGTWDFRSDTSSENPVTPSENPDTTSENPVASSENPITPSENPVIISENPITSSENPVASSENPVTWPKNKCFAAEASINMLLATEKNEQTHCEINSVELLFRPTHAQMRETLDRMLAKEGCELADIDAVLTGINTNPANDDVYFDVVSNVLENRPMLQYKHVFGESFSSSAVAVYVAATCLQKGKIPLFLHVDKSLTKLADRQITPPKRILVYNHYKNKSHSFILLSSCSN